MFPHFPTEQRKKGCLTFAPESKCTYLLKIIKTMAFGCHYIILVSVFMLIHAYNHLPCRCAKRGNTSEEMPWPLSWTQI